MTPILEWIDAERISANPEIKSRNLFARAHSGATPVEISQRYIHLSPDEMQAFLRGVFRETKLALSGTGVELGAGTAAVSNAVASIFPSVDQIYAVEIVPDVVRLLQVKITSHFHQETKVLPVIGSFDEIRLPDESVDFIIEFDSLHHSNDLDKTLREASRVLKKGGKLVALDRVHFDSLTEEQKQHLLDIEYSETFKREYGMPLDTKLTRRDNGEHEIREGEWLSAFEGAGLKVEQFVLFHQRNFRAFALGLISNIPLTIRRLFNFYPKLPRFHLSMLLFYVIPPLARAGSRRMANFPVRFSRREAFMSKTVIIATKK